MTQDNRPLTIGIVGTGAANMRMFGDGTAEIKDPITAAPVIQGPRGRAWLCDEAAGIRARGLDPREHASLGHWVIEAPWAHPYWHSYSLVLVHLRPIAGKSTMLYLDDATHEIWLHAVNPHSDRRKVLANGIIDFDFWLLPKNFAAQFIEISDALAIERATHAVQHICDGTLSPDTDYISSWRALFGDNMMKDRPNAQPPRVRSS